MEKTHPVIMGWRKNDDRLLPCKNEAKSVLRYQCEQLCSPGSRPNRTKRNIPTPDGIACNKQIRALDICIHKIAALTTVVHYPIIMQQSRDNKNVNDNFLPSFTHWMKVIITEIITPKWQVNFDASKIVDLKTKFKNISNDYTSIPQFFYCMQPLTQIK